MLRQDFLSKESDFLKVDTFKENEDGSVSWVWDEGEGLPTNSGVIREGFTRTTQVQDGTASVQVGTEQVQVGTETVVVGQEPVLDEKGDPVIAEDTGEALTQDITEEVPVYEEQPVMEEQPKMVDVEINVWNKLWELHSDPSSSVTVESVDLSLIKDNAKQVVNRQRDSLISGGVVHNGHTFQTDSTSIMDIMGAIMSGIDTTWLTADNQQVSMSSADMQALGQAVAQHKETLVFKARVHKDNIESLSTKAEIDDYVANLRWED